MKRRVVWGVIGAHLVLVGTLALLSRRPCPTTQPCIPLVVHTVKALPPQPPPKPIVRAASRTKPVPKPQPKPESKPTPAVSKPSSQRKKLVAAAKQQLATIKPTTDSAPPPKPIAPLKFSQPSHNYGQELALYLRKALELPEYGSVKIELMLAKDGSITALHIVESHNPRNQAYVQSALPTLKLPPPDKPQALTLTLTNAT